MSDSLESHGYFKQQLLRNYYSGRQVFKGFALKSKSVVRIQQQTFSQSRQALLHHQEMRQFQAFDHLAAGIMLDCLFFNGSPSVSYVIEKLVKVGLDDEYKLWSEDELEGFIEKFVDLFAAAETRGLYYRNITPGNFRCDGDAAYRLYEFSGYYYLKKPSAYISPALRRYLQATDDENGLGSPLPFHNPYKTEVYALGVVVLELIYGRYLEEVDSADEGVKLGLEKLIKGSWVSERMKDVLRRMLDFNEESRLDPLELSLYLKSQLPIPEILPTLLQNHHKNLSIIQIKIESDSLLQAEEGSKFVVLSCVCCFVPIRVEASSDVEELEVLIPLKCPVKNHVFCRAECMMKYAFIETKGRAELIETLKCPVCQYSLPGEIRAKINELWQDSDALPRPMTHSKSARFSPEKQATSIRRSVPGIFIDFSPDIVQKGGCLVCCLEGNPEERILAHEGEEHFFCGESCWKEYVAAVGEGREVECPVDGCGLKIDVRRAEGGGFEEESGQSVVSSSALSISLGDFPPTCVRCGHFLMPPLSQSYTFETQPVFLYCQPPDHAFCSKSCFRTYIESCTNHFRLDVERVTCPACFEGVEKELVYECYGGEEVYKVLQEMERDGGEGPMKCMECKVYNGETMPCGHAFCAKCRLGWSSKILLRNCETQPSMPCPVCNKPTGVLAHSRLRRVYDYVKASFLGI